ncbi:MAG: hypothetical protein HKN21_13270, partial [Candidatus Eisenbacteria bacterium]|nr:hypothetical protein [Candidatus Eisenbacteria bacterium]
MKRWILGLLTLAMMTLPGPDTEAGTPDNGTLTETVTVLNYTAGPFLVSNPTGVNGDPPVCLPETCDDYTLTVNLPANYQASNPDERVVIQIAWANANTDFDVYVLENGQEKTDAATSNNPEVIVLPAESAVYTIRVVAFAVAGDTFNGTITLGTPTSAGTGVGLYEVSNDVFTCNTHLTGQEGIFSHDGDAEPGVKFTPDGVAWVGSNAGLGAGIGLWRISDICAQDFTFLGSPDAGAGGGDVDIVVATEPNINGFYNIYTSSLTLANVTSSVSMDGGATFIPTVVSDVTPINDRQWNAAYGAGTVYLSYRSLNTGNELFVVRSDANGLPGTFVGPFLVYADVVVDAALATQLGNMVCDRRPGANTPVASGPNGEGNVYHGFVLQGNKVYVAVSKDFGVTWSSKLVFEGPLTDAYDHNFTWVAVDDAGNVYTCFSDGNDCFYAVSQDQGDTWSQP